MALASGLRAARDKALRAAKDKALTGEDPLHSTLSNAEKTARAELGPTLGPRRAKGASALVKQRKGPGVPNAAVFAQVDKDTLPLFDPMPDMPGLRQLLDEHSAQPADDRLLLKSDKLDPYPAAVQAAFMAQALEDLYREDKVRWSGKPPPLLLLPLNSAFTGALHQGSCRSAPLPGVCPCREGPRRDGR